MNVPLGNVQFGDVSEWQGVIDWDKWPWPVAVIRAGYGNTYQDRHFARNWKEAKDRGILRSAYWFHVPGKSPQKHFESFMTALGNDPGELPPVWDEEYLGDLASPSLIQNFMGLNRGDLFSMGQFYEAKAPSAFQKLSGILFTGLKQDLYEEVSKLTLWTWQSLGVHPLIYTNYSFWTSYMPESDIERDCELFIANWDVASPRVPNHWAKRGKTWTWWQKDVLKGTGPTWGAESQDIDWDENNGGWPDLLTHFKLPADWVPWGGTPTPPPPPPADHCFRLVSVQDGLRVRSGPGTAFPITGTLNKGEIVEPLEIAGTDAWVRHKDGWSNVKLGNDTNMVSYQE